MTEPTINLTVEPLAVPPHQAAKLLNVSEPTLRKLNIPRVKIGTSGVRYSVDVLREWLREHSEALPVEAGEETHP